MNKINFYFKILAIFVLIAGNLNAADEDMEYCYASIMQNQEKKLKEIKDKLLSNKLISTDELKKIKEEIDSAVQILIQTNKEQARLSRDERNGFACIPEIHKEVVANKIWSKDYSVETPAWIQDLTKEIMDAYNKRNKQAAE